MSICNRLCSVQLIKIATRNKKTIFWKNPLYPRFWRVKQCCARHSYVYRRRLYVIYIATQTPSFRRSRDLDKSNKFGKMKELTNDNYSEIKLCSIFRIEYRAIAFSTNKKSQQVHSRSQYWNDNEAAPADGGFMNKANGDREFPRLNPPGQRCRHREQSDDNRSKPG